MEYNFDWVICSRPMKQVITIILKLSFTSSIFCGWLNTLAYKTENTNYHKFTLVSKQYPYDILFLWFYFNNIGLLTNSWTFLFYSSVCWGKYVKWICGPLWSHTKSATLLVIYLTLIERQIISVYIHTYGFLLLHYYKHNIQTTLSFFYRDIIFIAI